MGYSNILVPLDGSELAELALHHIDRVASQGAQIHLLIVVDSLIAEVPAGAIMTLLNGVYWTATIPFEQKSFGQSTRDLHEFNLRIDYLQRVSERLTAKGYEVKVDALPGDVVETIVETARDGYDVIVMATHGRTGLRRVLLGSVAEGVLHHAPCPVLLIPAGRAGS